MDTPKQLLKGSRLALRLWDEADVHDKTAVSREYETAGYVLEGTATLTVDGKEQILQAGDAYLVPAGALHKYEITGRFRCVEATSV